MLVIVVIANHPDKAYRGYAKRLRGVIDKNEPLNDDTAACTNGEHGTIGMFFRDDVNHADVGHEIKHAVENTLLYIESKVKEGDEVFAYLTGYIHKRVYRIFRKHKIKIK